MSKCLCDQLLAVLDRADIALERQGGRAERFDFGLDLLGESSRMSARTILLAPSSANRRAVARPNPLPPPVITAVRPSSRGPRHCLAPFPTCQITRRYGSITVR